MDIGSAQRLAAYTADLGIETTRGKRIAKADPAGSASRVEGTRPAETSGIRLSLSSRAISQASVPSTDRAGTPSGAAEITESATAGASTVQETGLARDADASERTTRSNRGNAIATYQRIASSTPGSRVQVVA